MEILKFSILLSIVFHSAAAAVVIDARTARRRLPVQTQESCRDCTQILELFGDVISDTGTQHRLKNTLGELCSQLPNNLTQNLCLDQVKQDLPMVIQFLTGIIKTNQICVILGACKTQSRGMEQEVLPNYFAEFRIPPGPGTMTEMPSALPCTLCVFVFKILGELIPMAEGIIVQVLGYICGILPMVLRMQCNVLVKLWIPQLLDLLLSWITPENVCSLLQLCLFQDRVSPDCHSCQMLAILARFHLGSNATELQTSAFLESVCSLHSSSIPKCDSFTQRNGALLQKALTGPMGIQEQCEEALFCAVAEDSDAVGGYSGDPCRRGFYRCRDIKTAEKCNSVSFCEKYMWT